jgi:hypothetical protein
MPSRRSPVNGSGNGRLTLAKLAAAKYLSVAFLKGLGLRDERGGVVIPYFDAAGNPTHEKRRTALVAKEGSWWPSGVPVESYGDWKLGEANRAGFLIIGEDESDGWASWYHEVPYLGIPGANNAKVLTHEHVACVGTVYVVREPGQSGDTFVPDIVARLRKVRFEGRAFELRMPDDLKDLADLHADDADRFQDRLRAAVEAATPLDLTAAASAPEPWEEPIPLGAHDEVKDFPTRVLPGDLVDYVDCVATSIGCPADFVGVPLLAVASGALEASRALKVKDGWRERPSLYVVVVGNPGSGKTPALGAVCRPLYDRQNRHKRDYDQKQAEYERLCEDYEARKKAREDPLPPKPVAPVQTHLYANDFTVESLAPILKGNPRGVCIVRDELTAWVKEMDRFRKGGGDRQFFLQAWSGQSWKIDRKQQNGASLIVPHPFLSIVGGLPPDRLPDLRGDEDVDDGFLDRDLFSFPKVAGAPRHNDHCVPDATHAIWADVLDALWQHDLVDNGDGTFRPKDVHFTLNAKALWRDFFDGLADEMNDDCFPDHLRGAWTKLRAYGARLALVVHFLRLAAEEVRGEDVDEESMRRAGLLIDYFKSHAAKVYARLAADPKVFRAKKVLAWVRRNGKKSFSKRDLHNGLQGTFATALELDEPLGVLVSHGYIRPQPSPDKTSTPGRKPSPVYDVNPLTLSTDYTQSTE